MFKTSYTQRYLANLQEYVSKNMVELILNSIVIIGLGALIYFYGLIPTVLSDEYNVEKELYASDWYDAYQMYFNIACYSMIALHVLSFFVYYVDVRTPELTLMNKINQTIVPGLIWATGAPDGEHEAYSIQRLLESRVVQDILQLAYMNPEQFWSDYADLVKISIYKTLETRLSVKELKYIKSLISDDVFKAVDMLINNYGMDRYREFMSASAQAVNKELLPLDFPRHSYESVDQYKHIDYRLLIDHLSNFFSHCRELIVNVGGVATNPRLQNFQEFNILDLDPEHESYYESTFAYAVARQVQEQGTYDINSDNVLMQWYYSTLAPNYIPISFQNKPIDSSTDHILELIESKMEILRETSVMEWQPCVMTPHDAGNALALSFETQVCPDRTIDQISQSIKNHGELNLDLFPYYYNLVPDLKQVKLVFDQEADILTYLNQLKICAFGEDLDQELYFEEGDVYITLKEIINGFMEDEAGESTHDLRLILEVYFKELDWAVNMELQCYAKRSASFKEVERKISMWEANFESYSALLKQKEEVQWMENSSKWMVLLWRLLYAIAVLMLLWVSVSSYNYVQQYIQFRVSQCTASSNIPDYLMDKCKTEVPKMSSAQQFNFCTDHISDLEVRTMCSNYPLVYYHHCMMSDISDNFLQNLCTNHWLNNFTRFNYQEQFNFCSLYINTAQVYNSCSNIQGIYYDLCMMEDRDAVSPGCAEYWDNYHTQYTPKEQILYCNRFQSDRAVVATCSSQLDIFKEICILHPSDQLPNYCEDWFENVHTIPEEDEDPITDSQLEETDQYIFCYYFQTNSNKIHNLCRRLTTIYYNICFMQRYDGMVESTRCKQFFLEQYELLTDDQQMYFCQRYGKIYEIGKLCYNFEHMINFLYDICMMIPFNRNSDNCVTYFNNKYLTLDNAELSAFCDYYSDLKEVNLICWKQLGYPVKFSQDKDYAPVCAYTTTNVACSIENSTFKKFRQLALDSIRDERDYDLFMNFSISENAMTRINLDKSYYGEVSNEIYGQNLALYDSGSLQVQTTSNGMIVQNINRQLYTNFEFTQDFNYRMAEYIYMGYNHTCWLDNKDFSCAGNTSFGNNIPEGWNNGIITAGTGSYHMCAIKEETGELRCWGRNFEGQTDVPEMFEQDAQAVMGMYSWSCALDINRFAFCWGNSTFNDLPEEITDTPIRHFDGYSDFGCMIRESDLLLKCWGTNWYGGIDVPEDKQNLQVYVSVGAYQTCALDQNSYASCWGESTVVHPDFTEQPILRLSTGLELNCMIRHDFLWRCNSYYSGTVYTDSTIYFELSAGNREICGGETGGTVNCFAGPDNEVTRLLEYYPAEEGYVLPMQGQRADYFSLSQGDFVCFSLGDFYCTLDKHKTMINVNPYRELFCTTRSLLCYVKESSMHMLECVDPNTPNEAVEGYTINEGVNIVEVGCNTDRVCVRFEDHTILCKGGDNIYGENDILSELTYCTTIYVGKETTCCMKEDKRYYCNGVLISHGAPSMFEGLIIREDDDDNCESDIYGYGCTP